MVLIRNGDNALGLPSVVLEYMTVNSGNALQLGQITCVRDTLPRKKESILMSYFICGGRIKDVQIFLLLLFRLSSKTQGEHGTIGLAMSNIFITFIW